MDKVTSKQQQTNKKGAGSIVKPIAQVAGETHPLAELFEGDPADIPTLKSIGFAQLSPGSNWISYVMTTKGEKVISIEVAEPDHRTIAEESSKINFVTEFVDGGF